MKMQGERSAGALPPVSLATWQGRGGFAARCVPASVFASAYPCGPP